MKRLLTVLIVGLGLTAASQTSLPWTNGVAIYTNINFGQISVPLSSNAWFAMSWQADQYNGMLGLTGTNRFKAKDIVAAAAWMGCEGSGSTIIAAWQSWLQQQADASVKARAIKQKLNQDIANGTVSDAILDQILALLP